MNARSMQVGTAFRRSSFHGGMANYWNLVSLVAKGDKDVDRFANLRRRWRMT